jgi:hypothetical protein
MSNLWQCLESLAGGNHVAAEWAKLSGEQFPPLRAAFLRDTQDRARFIPCPLGCGCEHEIVPRAGGKLAAVCRCEPWNCDDIAVTAADVALLGLNTAKLGRTLSKVFECDLRETRLPLPLTWQIGAKFANGVPVFLTIQNERASFRRVVAELTARQRDRFILLAPTNRWLDSESRELLNGAKAGFFDLETNLVLMPTGKLQPRRRPGELFQPFAPDAQEPADETVFAQIFALIEKMDADEQLKDPSVMKVFRFYCGRGLGAQAVADKCGCAKATVLKRLDKIRQVTGKDPQELRAYSPFFKKIDDAITDSRAEHIHRKSLVHDIEESGDESE